MGSLWDVTIRERVTSSDSTLLYSLLAGSLLVHARRRSVFARHATRGTKTTWKTGHMYSKIVWLWFAEIAHTSVRRCAWKGCFSERISSRDPCWNNILRDRIFASNIVPRHPDRYKQREGRSTHCPTLEFNTAPGRLPAPRGLASERHYRGNHVPGRNDTNRNRYESTMIKFLVSH